MSICLLCLLALSACGGKVGHVLSVRLCRQIDFDGSLFGGGGGDERSRDNAEHYHGDGQSPSGFLKEVRGFAHTHDLVAGGESGGESSAFAFLYEDDAHHKQGGDDDECDDECEHIAVVLFPFRPAKVGIKVKSEK